MQRRTRWSRNRQVQPITEEMDFTCRTTIELAKARIRSKFDALWLSCPCTGGSSWVHINWARGEGCRAKIRQHWVLFHRIWKAFEEVAEHALSVGARVFIEWPRGCSYRREPAVVKFMNKHRLAGRTSMDACMGCVLPGGLVMGISSTNLGVWRTLPTRPLGGSSTKVRPKS